LRYVATGMCPAALSFLTARALATPGCLLVLLTRRDER